MIRIQLVDNEPNILSSLRRQLKPQGWQIDTFTRVEKALGALLEYEYAAIVSDYQMPTADGVTYLQFAKQKQPDAIRMVLSACVKKTMPSGPCSKPGKRNYSAWRATIPASPAYAAMLTVRYC